MAELNCGFPNSVSVVIPTFNGKHLLEKNIPSVIEALEISQLKYEIIVSDDASTDDTSSFIRNNFPEIIFLEKSINQGFSHTINLGIQKASYDLCMLLNNDICLDPNYFKSQLNHFKDEAVFGVMGLMLYDEKSKAVAEKATMFRVPLFGHIKVTEKQEYAMAQETFFMSGGNSLVVTEKLKKLNGFSTIFSPFYHEDVDLSIRAWRLGWKCMFEPKAVCFHPKAATIKKEFSTSFISTIEHRNRILVNLIHRDDLRPYLFFIWTKYIIHSLKKKKKNRAQSFREAKKLMPEVYENRFLLTKIASEMGVKLLSINQIMKNI